MLLAICDIIRCDAEVTAESPVLGDCFNGKMFLSLSKFYLTELELFKWTVNAKTKACVDGQISRSDHDRENKST